MSNSYDVNKLLPNPSSTVSGAFVDFQTPERLANSSNYSFAQSHCYNVLNQSYADKTFIQSSGSFIEMSEWRIPLVSLEHNQLDFVVHYNILGSSSNCNIQFTLKVDTASTSTVLNCPSTAEISSGSLSISFASSSQYYATLTASVQADPSSNAEIEIKTIIARFHPLSSPISAGLKNQYEIAEGFTPFGTSRTSQNQAFTSRFGHNMLDNCNILRTRMKSILTWSGCYNSNSSLLPSYIDAAAPEVFVGVGHQKILHGYAFAPSGYDALNHKTLELHVKYIGASTNTEFDFFGNRITLAAGAGVVSWSTHEIDIDYEKISERGDIRLPYYLAYFDNTDKNKSNLMSYARVGIVVYPNIHPSNYGQIVALTLMGV